MTLQTTSRRTAPDVSRQWETFDKDYELQNILRAADSLREGESFAGLLRRARELGREGSEAQAAPAPRARHFTCDAADLGSVRALLGQPGLTAANLQTQVTAAARRAVAMIERAAAALERKPRAANIRSHFLAAFGSTPELVPPWRPANARWADRGDIAALRLRAAAKLLTGGFIRYFCWGDSKYPECRECTWPSPTTFACSSFQSRLQVCFGPLFWTDPVPDGRAATLLHEALHIYFGRLIGHGERGGRHGSADCYEFFLMLVNNRPSDTYRVSCTGA